MCWLVGGVTLRQYPLAKKEHLGSTRIAAEGKERHELQSGAVKAKAGVIERCDVSGSRASETVNNGGQQNKGESVMLCFSFKIRRDINVLKRACPS